MVGKLIISHSHATETWLQLLSLLTPNTIDNIINKIPSSHITEIEKSFAKDLLKYNRQDFLELEKDLGIDTVHIYQKLAKKIASGNLNQINKILANDYLVYRENNKIQINQKKHKQLISIWQATEETPGIWAIKNHHENLQQIKKIYSKVGNTSAAKKRFLKKKRKDSIDLE